MYCSICGKPITGNMNYCNSCGAPTENNAVSRSRMSPWGLFIISATFIVIFGIIGLVTLLKVLLERPLDPSSVTTIVVAYLATMLLMFSTMVGLGWKQLSAQNRRKNSEHEPEEYRSPASFKGVNTSQLPAGEPGIGSVTDVTTRTLDEAAIRRS